MASVLFVCLGNICRSPMAEAMMAARLQQEGRDDVLVDSAGTAAYHAGEPPDRRTVSTLAQMGITRDMSARQVHAEDFERFDLILAMDGSNLAHLQRACPAEHRHKVHLVLSPNGGGDVPDPYYGGPEGFMKVASLLETALDHWLEAI